MKNLVLLAILFLICNTGYAQSVPTVGEVYNFEIGDEFTYQGGSNSSTLGNHTSSEWVGITLITNRIDSFDNNSQLVAITYTKSFKKFDTISQYHQGTSWNDITNTAIENDITYTNLSDPVFSVCNIQDVACDDTSYINQVTIQDSILVTNFIKDNRYNDYNTIPLDSNYHRKYAYAVGLGITSYWDGINVKASNQCHCSQYSYSELLRFRKTTISAIAKELNRKENEVKIFPNPANDIVSLDMQLSKNSTPAIMVFNIDGQQQYVDTKIENDKPTFSVKNLKPGVYIVKVKADSKTATCRLICL